MRSITWTLINCHRRYSLHECHGLRVPRPGRRMARPGSVLLRGHPGGGERGHQVRGQGGRVLGSGARDGAHQRRRVHDCAVPEGRSLPAAVEGQGAPIRGDRSRRGSDGGVERRPLARRRPVVHRSAGSTTLGDMSRIFTVSFASVYPLYVTKVERKGRTKAELDQVIEWLTGFDESALERHLAAGTTFEDFFADASLNPQASSIT